MSADLSGEFLDTNVLVYAHDVEAGEKYILAADLVKRLVQQRRAALSVQVLQEFFVTVTRKLTAPLSSLEAEVIVSDLAELLVHAPQPVDVLAAIQLCRKLPVSFWDAMVIRSASQLGCTTLWSEDLASEETYEGVTVKNPFLAAGSHSSHVSPAMPTPM